MAASAGTARAIPGRAKSEQIPLPVRIVHVARDAAFQRMLGGPSSPPAWSASGRGAPSIRPSRIGFQEAETLLALDDEASAWVDVLGREPSPQLTLEGEAVERALAAIGDFADLASPYLVGHSRGVAELAGAAARLCGFDAADLTMTVRGPYP